MAYSDTVKAFKDALSVYSEEENKLSELYKNAIALNEQSKNERLSQLEADYKAERNNAFSDNAFAEQSVLRSLASRGLGFSGEAAQTKLNSKLSLSNRLSELARENAKSKSDIIEDHAERKSELEGEEADKRARINESRSKLLYDIASAELEGGSSAEGSTETDSAEDRNEGTNDGNDIFAPDVKPKDLAKLMVENATGGDYIKTEKDAYLVNKYLLDAIDNYNLSAEYEQELLFMLKAYGYKELEYKELRKSVIAQDVKEETDSSFTKIYKQFIDNGISPTRARSLALSKVNKDAFDYIYSKTNSLDEFLEYCKAAGLNSSSAEDYASGKSWQASTTKTPTSSGAKKNNTTVLMK